MASRKVSGAMEVRHAVAAALVLFCAVSPAPCAQSSTPVAVSPEKASLREPAELTPGVPVGKPDYEAATRPDQIGRVIVPVMVNHQGPFKFALDTGANCTVLTPRLVAALDLPAVADTVTMRGATGSAEVPTAFVERVAAGDVVLEQQHLPVAEALTNEIDGILGVDGLTSKRVLVDFTNHRIEIRDARRERPIGWTRRIPAELRFGGLIVVNAYVDRIPVKAVIDTGSQYTLGNQALQVALAALETARVPYAAVDVLGETSISQSGQRQPVATISLGELKVSNLRVTFGDFNVFRLWDLDNRPAVVIGMDLIGRLDTLVIDYERHEVQLRTREQRRNEFQR